MKYIGIFYKIRSKLPLSILRNIYFAFVYPHILYHIEIYANWSKCYLSSQSFRVKCHSSSSSCISVVFLRVLFGPLLFIMYTTPLSTLISSLSLNLYLYADDTQLFLSFYPSNLDSIITHLQNALQLYPPGCPPTFWLLTLQKLNFASLDSDNWLKLTPAHLTQYTLLVILVSFLMNILLFLTRYLRFLNPATRIFISFNASVHSLISNQPVPLLPPSFTLSLTTATHFTIS